MKNILIYNSGGGLGDSIQLFPLILSLKNHFKLARFFYLGAHENHFENKLKDYNVNLKSLGIDLKYFGFRFWHYFAILEKISKLNIPKFDLIIDLQSKIRNTIILKKIPHIDFYSSTLNHFFCTKKNNYVNKNYFENIIKFLDQRIEYKEYNIKDLPQKFFDEATKLLPGNNYIGLSLTQGNQYRKKSWDLHKFIDLAINLKKKNKSPVFFIEKKNINLINKIKSKVPNALFPELNSSIVSPALVTALSTRLEKGITIDNGVMHMMGIAKIPLITLFGPTNSEKFSPSYANVKILDSKVLYKTKDVNFITVEDVLKYI